MIRSLKAIFSLKSIKNCLIYTSNSAYWMLRNYLTTRFLLSSTKFHLQLVANSPTQKQITRSYIKDSLTWILGRMVLPGLYKTTKYTRANSSKIQCMDSAESFGFLNKKLLIIILVGWMMVSLTDMVILGNTQEPSISVLKTLSWKACLKMTRSPLETMLIVSLTVMLSSASMTQIITRQYKNKKMMSDLVLINIDKNN